MRVVTGLDVGTLDWFRERRKSRRNRPLPRDATESQKCRSPHSDLGLTVKRQRAGPISTGGPARFHDWEFR